MCTITIYNSHTKHCDTTQKPRPLVNTMVESVKYRRRSNIWWCECCHLLRSRMAQQIYVYTHLKRLKTKFGERTSVISQEIGLTTSILRHINRVVCWSAAPHHAPAICLNMCWHQYCTIDVHTNTHTACTALKIKFLKLPTKTHKNPLTVIDSSARYCLRMAQSDRGDQ